MRLISKTATQSISYGRYRYNPLTVVLWLAIFIPGHLFDWLVERGFVAFFCIIAIVSLFQYGLPKRVWHFDFSVFIALFFILQISSLLAFLLTINTHSEFIPGHRNYIELARFLIWFLFFSFLLIYRKLSFIQPFEKAVRFSLFFSLFVFLCFVIDFPIMTTLFKDFMYADTKTAIQLGGWIRLAVPFENPNFLGFYLLMILTYILFFYDKQRQSIMLLFFTLVLVFLTGSRSAWFASLIVSLFFVLSAIVESISERRFSSSFVMLLLFLSGLLLGLLTFYEDIINSVRLQMVVNAVNEGGILTEPNVAARIEMVENAWEYFISSPLIGWGSSKSMIDVVDNQIMIWAVNNGSIGTLIIFGFFILIFYFQIWSSAIMRHRFGVLAFWTACLIMLQTGAFLNNFRIGFIFGFFLLAINIKIKQFEEEHAKW